MNSNAEEVESGWILVSTDSVVVMSIRMDIPIQPMIGLRTHKGLLMPSRTMLHNGTIPTMTDLVITWNISMVKHGALLTVVMDARPPMDSRHLTDGAARISMKMDGRTPHRTGSPVLVVQRMLGQKIQPNGMTVMVMAEGTTSGTTADVCPSQPGTSVGQAQEATAGVAQIQMVTVGRILVMRSFMNQHNGEIRTATVTVTKPMEMRQMHVQRSAELQSLIDWVAEIPMVMVGRIPTDGWDAHPYGSADAFPTEALQWKDSDGDGFGDVPLGALRDDCPEAFGTSTRRTRVRGQQRRWLVE